MLIVTSKTEIWICMLKWYVKTSMQFWQIIEDIPNSGDRAVTTTTENSPSATIDILQKCVLIIISRISHIDHIL